MSLFPEDDKPRPKAAQHVVGQDVSQLSVEELARRIAELEAEIVRLTEARQAKLASRNAADAFFRPKG